MLKKINLNLSTEQMCMLIDAPEEMDPYVSSSKYTHL